MIDSSRKREPTSRLSAFLPSVSPRHWLRYSLRAFLIAVTLLCVWIGMTARQARLQKRAVEAIQNAGGQIYYKYRASPAPPGPYGTTGGIIYDHRVKHPGSGWLHRLVGKHFFMTPVSLFVDDQRVISEGSLTHLKVLNEIELLSFDDVELDDDDLIHLRNLKNLRNLHLGDDSLPQSGGALRFQFLRRCRQLNSLSVADGSFGNDDLVHLSDLSGLTHLFLDDSLVDDAGLVHLSQLTNLKILGLSITSITDDGLAHLSPLTNLSYLNLSWTEVTDKGLNHLKNLKGLDVLELHGTQVTDAGARRLQLDLPNCTIKRDPATVVQHGE